MKLPFVQLQLLEKKFEKLFEPFLAGAILNQDGKVMYLKSQWPQDYGTLKNCAKIVKNYFPIDNEDLILTNDPYNGGTHPSGLNFICGLQIGSQKLHFIFRHYLPHRMSAARDLKNEGIKIPPMQISQGKELHSVIVDSMAMDPFLGQDFKPFIADFSQRIWRQLNFFKRSLSSQMSEIEKGLLNQFLFQSSANLMLRFAEFGIGDEKIDLHLESGEKISLHLQFNGEGFLLNFAGTNTSQNYFLSEASTVGACINGIVTLFPRSQVINENILAKVVVNIPTQCFLNAKNPSPTTAGAKVMAPLISQLVKYVAHKVVFRRQIDLLPALPTHICFRSTEALKDPSGFVNSSLPVAALTLFSGSSARQTGPGYDVLSVNIPAQEKLRHFIHDESTKINSDFVSWSAHSLRKTSAGKGRHRGGLGSHAEIKIHKPLQASFVQLPKTKMHKEVPSFNISESAEIILQKSNGDKLVLTEAIGQVILGASDILIIKTSGGAGFGKPESE